MTRTVQTAFFSLAAVGFAGCTTTGTSHELAFMEGTWTGDAWGGTFTARYASDERGVIGFSQLIRGDERAFHEFEVFDAQSGTPEFWPFPGGSPAQGLTYSEEPSTPTRAVFENRAKDYPTRIVYEVEGDTLTITLDDPHGGSDKCEVFVLDREG